MWLIWTIVIDPRRIYRGANHEGTGGMGVGSISLSGVGSVLGGWLFAIVGLGRQDGLIARLIMAAVGAGAVVLLWLVRALKRA